MPPLENSSSENFIGTIPPTDKPFEPFTLLSDNTLEAIFDHIPIEDRQTRGAFGLVCKRFLVTQRRFATHVTICDRSLIPHLRTTFPRVTSVALAPMKIVNLISSREENKGEENEEDENKGEENEEDEEEVVRSVNTIVDEDLIFLATNFPLKKTEHPHLRELILVQSDFWPHDQISHTGLSALGHFRKLRKLELNFSYKEASWGQSLFDLGANGWESLSVACSQMEHLRDLSLIGLEDYYSPICGEVLSPLFASCTHLRTLAIEDCKLRLDLHSLGSCRRLKTLRVRCWNHMRMEEIKEISECCDLRELDLRWRPAFAVDPNPTLVEIMEACTKLEKLSIKLRATATESHHSLDQTLDAAISHLRFLKAMEIAAFMLDPEMEI